MEIYRTLDGTYREGQSAEGRQHLVAALRRSLESKDMAARDHTLQAVARLWQKRGDSSLPGEVAGLLATSLAEAEGILLRAIRDE